MQLTNIAETQPLASSAETVTRAFSSDPLILWLRPHGDRWGSPCPEIAKWQRRRLQHSILRGRVFYSAPVKQTERMFPPRNPRRLSAEVSPSSSSTTEHKEQRNDGLLGSEDSDAGAVVMLFPPRSQMGCSIYRIYLTCKLWLLDLVDRTQDRGADEGVSEFDASYTKHIKRC